VAEHRIEKGIHEAAGASRAKLEFRSISVSLLFGTISMKQVRVTGESGTVATSVELIKTEMPRLELIKLILNPKLKPGKDIDYLRRVEASNMKVSVPQLGQEIMSAKSCDFRAASDKGAGLASMRLNAVSCAVPSPSGGNVSVSAEQLRLEIPRTAIVSLTSGSELKPDEIKMNGVELEASNLKVSELNFGTEITIKRFISKEDGDANHRRLSMDFSDATLVVGRPEARSLLATVTFLVESLRLKADYEEASRQVTVDVALVSSAGNLNLAGIFSVEKSAPQDTEIRHCRITISRLSKDVAQFLESIAKSSQITLNKQGTDIVIEITGTLGRPRISSTLGNSAKLASSHGCTLLRF